MGCGGEIPFGLRSGIEAATVAWKPLGWEAVAFSEIEPFPAAVLAHHYPDTPNLGDMTKFKEWPNATFDVLVGGTPCQSFSVAGLRKGLDDPRGNLMLTFGAIAGRYRPEWLVWENVPGVLSSNGGQDFASFLGLITGQVVTPPKEGWQNSGILSGYQSAYGVAWRTLDAQYFGVPQRRRRVFVVGHLGDWRRAAAVLFEQHSLSGNPPPSRKKGSCLAPTIRAGAANGGAGHGARSGDSKDELITVVAALTANGVGTCGADDNQGQAGHLIPATAMLTDGSRGTSVDQAAGGMIIPFANAGYFGTMKQVEVADSVRAQGGDTGNGGETLVCFGGGNTAGPVNISTTCNAHSGGRLDFDGETFVCGTLQANGKAAGSATQQDAESGLLIPVGPRATTQYGDVAGTLTSRHDSSPCADRGQNIIAFPAEMSGTQCAATENLSPTLSAKHTIAFTRNQCGDVLTGDISPSMGTNQNATGRNCPKVMTSMQVRRLMPIECERLQGFEDNYTQITGWNGWRDADESTETPEQLIALGLTLKKTKNGVWRVNDPDGPRYKALGNSMHTGTMRWIGERIQMVSEIDA